MPDPLNPDVQLILDQIGTTPGMLVYRRPEGWRALAPGNTGQVLALNAAKLPVWVNPASIVVTPSVIRSTNSWEPIAASSSAAATKGIVFIPDFDIDVHSVLILAQISNGWHYKAFIGEIPAATGTPALSAVNIGDSVAGVTNTTTRWLELPFAIPISLTAGLIYAIGGSISDQSDTTILPIAVLATVGPPPPISGRVPGVFTCAKKAPAITNTLTLSVGAGAMVGVGFDWLPPQ